jgi:hypothetical protein
MKKRSKSIYLKWLKWTALVLYIAAIIGISAIDKSGDPLGVFFFLLILSALGFFLFIVLTGRHRRGPGMSGGGFFSGGGFGGGGASGGW